MLRTNSCIHSAWNGVQTQAWSNKFDQRRLEDSHRMIPVNQGGGLIRSWATHKTHTKIKTSTQKSHWLLSQMPVPPGLAQCFTQSFMHACTGTPDRLCVCNVTDSGASSLNAGWLCVIDKSGRQHRHSHSLTHCRGVIDHVDILISILVMDGLSHGLWERLDLPHSLPPMNPKRRMDWSGGRSDEVSVAQVRRRRRRSNSTKEEPCLPCSSVTQELGGYCSLLLLSSSSTTLSRIYHDEKVDLHRLVVWLWTRSPRDRSSVWGANAKHVVGYIMLELNYTRSVFWE